MNPRAVNRGDCGAKKVRLIQVISQGASEVYIRENPLIHPIMSVLKVVELLGNSTVSFEDAVDNIVKEASVTIKEIRSVYVQDMQVTVKDNKVAEYRVNAKVTFAVQHHWEGD